MATGAPLTIVDLARRTDPNGDVVDVAELLSQANEIYDDLVWEEGNTNTGIVYSMRTSIPSGYWRFIGQGIPMGKSTTNQARINCGMLEGLSVIDRKLIDMARDGAKFRYDEDNAFLEGMSQTVCQTFFYGNHNTNPASFTGFSSFYPTVSTATSAVAANVFDGTGVGSNNASVWLVGWSPKSIFGVFPMGSTAGLKLTPLNNTELAYDALGNPYPAALTHFKQEAGLCIKDWRWGSRYCNLDVTSAGLGGSAPQDLFPTMSNMVIQMPKMARGVSGITETDAKSEAGLVVRPAFYCNRTLRGFMDIQAIRDKNVLLGPKDYAGNPVDSYRSIPIRVVDQLLNSEARVV